MNSFQLEISIFFNTSFSYKTTGTGTLKFMIYVIVPRTSMLVLSLYSYDIRHKLFHHETGNFVTRANDE
jgi:hypothetical protein